MTGWLAALMVGIGTALAVFRPMPGRDTALPADLDRIAVAIEGVESSHGRDPAMWQPRLAGPQGPMQVSLAAAQDAGGGNRFDPATNRQLGRAYLGMLFRRYGNWRDALIAYNWGPGNLGRWNGAGRPPAEISVALIGYLRRVATELRSGPPGAIAPATAAAPVEPPPPQIHDPALRKAYDSDRADIARLHGFTDPGSSDDEAHRTSAVLTTMRSLAKRRGFEEFAALRNTAHDAAPGTPGLKEIAAVMIAKLEDQCATIVLIDQHRQRFGRP